MLGNPWFYYSPSLQDRKTIEREIKKNKRCKKITSALVFTADIFCHVEPSSAGLVVVSASSHAAHRASESSEYLSVGSCAETTQAEN